MAKTESEVRSLFAEFCNKVVKTGELILANVVEVDSQERTCTIIDDDTEYYGVRLQPITEGQSGVVLTPKAGAFVLVSRIEGGDLYVIAASEYDSLSAKIADTTLILDKDGIVANNGNNSGMVKIDKMIEWMEKVYEDLSTLKIKLAVHNVPPPTPEPLNPLGLTFDFKTPKPIKSNFEDKRFKH